MLRTTVISICIILAMVCCLGLADRCNLLDAVWEKTLPLRILTHRPSPQEIHLTEAEERLSAAQKRITELEQDCQTSFEKRKSLMVNLREHLTKNNMGNQPLVNEVMTQDPIAAATIRAIAAEDERSTKLKTELDTQKATLPKIEARIIAIKNGVSSLEDESFVPLPSEQICLGDSSLKSTYKKYEQILQEVGSITIRNEERQ